MLVNAYYDIIYIYSTTQGGGKAYNLVLFLSVLMIVSRKGTMGSEALNSHLQNFSVSTLTHCSRCSSPRHVIVNWPESSRPISTAGSYWYKL